MGGLRMGELLIILVVVLILFAQLGSSLGQAIKNFKKGFGTESDEPSPANNRAITAAMFDVDHYTAAESNEKLAAMFAALKNTAFIFYQTHTSRPEFPKLRLILPLSRECTAHEYKTITPLLIEHFKIPTKPGTLDPTKPGTLDPSWMFFLPNLPQGASDETAEIESQEGEAVDVAAFLIDASAAEFDEMQRPAFARNE